MQVGGAWALLNKPATARASVILIPGGDGVMGIKPDGTFATLKGNQLVRTRKAYLQHGVATLTVDSGVSIAQAVNYMRKIASPVYVVATSRGTLRVAGSLGAKPDGIVLTAGFLDSVKSCGRIAWRAAAHADRPPPPGRLQAYARRRRSSRSRRGAAPRSPSPGKPAAATKATRARRAAITASMASTATWSRRWRVSRRGSSTYGPGTLKPRGWAYTFARMGK